MKGNGNTARGSIEINTGGTEAKGEIGTTGGTGNPGSPGSLCSQKALI